MYKAFQIYRRRELKEYGRTREPDVTGVVSRGVHITGMSRVVSSINSPSPGLFRTCPTPRKYPAHVVSAVTSDVRMAGVTFATVPSWIRLLRASGPDANGMSQKGEESINTRLRGNSGFSFPARLPAHVFVEAPARNCFYLLSSRENRNSCICGVAEKTQQSVERFSKQNVMKTDSTASAQKCSK